ncbi:MAG: hypothetical protein ACHQ51_15555 [Elusimicrobiota bacterium]
MPRLRPEAQTLKQQTTTLAVAAAAGAAFAGFGGLLARWCANPSLGWGVALAAAALGAGLASRGSAPDEDGARAWALGGALAALGAPALLRFLGLALADPARLQDPLGGMRHALFVLGQAAFLAALAAGAWTRAARGGGRPAGVAAALGAAAGACAFRRIDPAALVAGAALAALAAAELAERPWSRRETAPLRARVFAAAAVVGLLLASLAPGLLRDVWMARLHGTYPGGRYLSFADDGDHVWAAYRFSTGNAVVLRDGLVQSLDQETSRLALCALLSQFEGKRALAILRPPTPQLPLMAVFVGASVSVENISAAQGLAFDALTAGQWRAGLSTVPASAFKPDAALLVLANPPRPFESRRAASAIRALRARMGDNAALAALIPSGAPAGTAERVSAAAAAAFGRARTADLPGAVLVLASTADIVEDSQLLFGRLPDAVRTSYPNGDRELAADLRWRALPSAK